MNEGWYALCISILKGVAPEEAFDLWSGEQIKNNRKNFITDSDVEDMIKLKGECTLGEIGYMYGLSPSGICRRIKRYQEIKINAKNKAKKPKKVKSKDEKNYIDDPIKLMKLKEKHTYKEIAKMYGTYPNKIYMDIRKYKSCC